MKTVTVITPTIGSKHLPQCINSVHEQSYECQHLIVIDGYKNFSDTKTYMNKCAKKKNMNYILLPENVGANGWYGHRIYAAFSFLVNTDYIVYLDEDNWLEPNHIESLMNSLIQSNMDWTYSNRNIYDKDGQFVCKDEFENNGKDHIDTSCFCISREIATKIGSSWYGQWGADRQFFANLKHYYPRYVGSMEYTMNYRLGGNPNSPTKEFFLNGNNLARRNNGKN